MAPPQDREPSDTPPFTVARHGYDREQVRQHLRRTDNEVRRAHAERDRAREQVAEVTGQLQIARREIAALTERLDTMSTQRIPKPAHEEQAARVVQLAETQAGEITSRAQASAEHTWSAAEQASAALRDRYQRLLADLDRQHEEIHTEHEQIMQSARAQVEEMTTAAQLRRKQIDDEAEAERDRIEREFQATMNSRREALDVELAERRAAAEQQAQQLVRTALDQANERITSANQELTRVTELRNSIAKRLHGTQELLNRSGELLKPLPDEADLTTVEGGTKPVPPELRQPEPST